MNINLGSKETMIVDVEDMLDVLTVLPAGTTYLIRLTDGTAVESNLVPTIDGLKALCLIDTTGMLYEPEDYDLFLLLPLGAEAPLLGPHRFRVV